MTLYRLKPAFQDALRPVAARFAAAGITANQVTAGAAIGSVVVGAMLALASPAQWPFLLLPVWLLARMALNALDGMLAREFGQKSRLGAYLNELGDVVSDAALYLPFALVAPFSPAAVVLVVLLSGLSEIAGVLGQALGASRRHDGPLGKSDRALVFGALGLWIGIAGGLPGWAAHAMPVLAALLVVTAVRRVRAGVSEVERQC